MSKWMTVRVFGVDHAEGRLWSYPFIEQAPMHPMSISSLKVIPLLALMLLSSAILDAQFDGYALYNNQNQTTTYLVDADGQIAHTWSCPSTANYSMALRSNGNIVRGAVQAGNQINGAAVGGKVQELNPQGQVVWEFVYSTADYVSHHDLCLMPNGNVLLIAWVRKTLTELQALGYTGTSAKYPGRIIEVQQNGTAGEIVWQWDLTDRFIQYTDANKPNYMPIAEHPERMNINVVTSGTGGGPGGQTDWFHENGIDYNVELDQISYSSRYLSEIFIIDHSTTTEEAAGHTGGNAGQGGDFLFRWGKPANYGITGTQRITAAVHDVGWVKADRPNAGWLMFVNNSGGTGNSTVIDGINPERDGYTYPWTPGTVWGPANYEWRHQCLANSSGQSAWDLMPNGNIFVALSDAYMYEVDEAGSVVWQYNASPPKAFRYTCDDAGISALLGPNPCGLATAVEERTEQRVSIYPNPTNGGVQLAGVDLSLLSSMVVLDATGREVMRIGASATLDLGGQADGLYRIVLEERSGACNHLTVVLQR